MNDVWREVREHIFGMWRRRWLCLATAWALMVVGSLVVALLPNRFDASSRIYVDTESLMGPLLKGIAVQDDLSQQLRVMQDTLLSRPNLMSVIRSLDLDLTVQSDVDMERLLDRIKSRTQVELSGPNIFTITYRDNDPVQAKDVVQSFLTIFVENNIGKDRADMESAQSFIEKQIALYKEQLRETEQKIADFRASYSGVISPTGTSFSTRLEQARVEVDRAKVELAESEAQATRLQAQLDQTPRFLQVPITDAGRADPTLVRLSELRTELVRKSARYTDSHPEISSIKQELEDLEARYQEAPLTNSQMSNPLFEQIKLRLIEAESSVAVREGRVAAASAAYERLRDRASTAPQLEAQLADMNRDYEVLRQKYEEFRLRSESARISQDARTDTEAIRFRIVEPPETPTIPSGPPRVLLLVGVLLAAIGGGLGITLLLTELDDTFGSPQQLSAATGIPVLGTVCQVQSPVAGAKRILDGMFVVAGAGAMVAYCGLVIVLTTDTLGTGLDLSTLRHLAGEYMSIGF